MIKGKDYFQTFHESCKERIFLLTKICLVVTMTQHLNEIKIMENILNDLIPLRKDEYKPLYAQISDALIDYIKRKGLKPGDPFPSETDIIEKYGVSRTTVRIAFQTSGYRRFDYQGPGQRDFHCKAKDQRIHSRGAPFGRESG